MNIWTNIKSKFSASGMRHRAESGGSGSNPFYQTFIQYVFGLFAGSKINYAREIGDLTGSRLIMAAVNFLGRTLPEARLEVVRRKPDGTFKVIGDHPLAGLIRRPNKFYTGTLFWKSLGLSWIISGNVFFYKVRNSLGEVIELWYLPHTAVEPRWENENSFIDYYAYAVDGYEYKLKPEDVIHLRNGIDPNNPRMGLSDIASGLREIYTDQEASSFSALLMKNNGVGPFAISPKLDTPMTDTDRKRLIDGFMRKTSGDERGKPFVSAKPFEIIKTGFNPDELDLSKLRHLPEETVASLTGIPAIILQFGAGLERSTYSNYAEAREAAYESVVVPLWKYIADELTAQLLAESDRSGKLEVRFNLSDVRVLQEDENKLVARVGAGYRTGIMKRSEVRSKIGLPVEPEDEVYFCEPKREEESAKAEGNDDKTKE